MLYVGSFIYIIILILQIDDTNYFPVYPVYGYLITAYSFAIMALIYSIVCFLKVSIFVKEYKSFALKNKGKLYLTGFGLSLSLIIATILNFFDS